MRNKQIQQAKSAKTHYRMYKSGKHWVFMGLTMATLGLGTTMYQGQAHADTTGNNYSQSTQTNTSATSNGSSSATSSATQSSTSTSSVATNSTTSSSNVESKTNSSSVTTSVTPSSTVSSSSNVVVNSSVTSSTTTSSSSNAVSTTVDDTQDISYRDGTDTPTVTSSQVVSSMNTAVSSASSAATSARSQFSSISVVMQSTVSNYFGGMLPPNSDAQKYLMSMGSTLADMYSMGDKSDLFNIVHYFMGDNNTSNLGSQAMNQALMGGAVTNNTYQSIQSLSSASAFSNSAYQNAFIDGAFGYIFSPIAIS